ncbi:Cytochrome c [Maioricimonas rarisocia]|uniref:Cytochrome c n=1 Tax=Maioricimonas rarisocia TaxID=2528026 RepID=A0A517Z883_9PLAN|nr:c-type cytochrome [Maioricimonas rarisocia]QDU38687.1 Cytochrome c [Maioricimonas rarisocia]
MAQPMWNGFPGSLFLVLMIVVAAAGAEETPAAATDQKADPDRGYRILREQPFLPADFSQQTFDQLWAVWPEPLRSQARNASAAERRRLAFSRYGLMEPPDSPGSGPALGYVPTEQGWVMNCLACHGGKVAGEVMAGLPNSHFAMQTLVEDVRKAKLLRLKPLSHLDVAAATIPLGTTNGTTNSVIFGVVLGALRRPDMSVDRNRQVPDLKHHDMDAPPFWNVRKKSRLYIDGFAPKTHRPLVQFMLLPRNDRKTVLGWEDEFRDILAWIESVQPPEYPGPVDGELADRGRSVFEKNCAECHGTYGADESYPERMIPIDVIGTDPLRLTALSPAHRQWMKDGWMSRFGEDDVWTHPEGYIAPPLDGIWASAPYFHNGSVPTLWHVLNSDHRPVVWKRTEDGYDHDRLGLEVAEFESVPPDVVRSDERRRYFDSRQPGKSAAGHTFPDRLADEEKRALLEYLKTL